MQQPQQLVAVKEFTISRKTWLRGEGSGNSYLLRDDWKQCCVGVFLSACGYSDERLRGQSAAREISEYLLSELEWLKHHAHKEGSPDRRFMYDLYNTNDLREVIGGEAEREAKITALFAEKGITVTFTD